MDGEALKALQAPLKDAYREDAGSALVPLRAEGSLEPGGLVCKVETGKALVAAGLHPATGGDGTAACSGDMLLEALVACAGVTLNAVSTAMGIAVKAGRVTATADFDARGTLGVDRAAPVGLTNIALRFDVETDADADQLATLLKLTERYCVVLKTLQAPAEVASEIAAA